MHNGTARPRPFNFSNPEDRELRRWMRAGYSDARQGMPYRPAYETAVAPHAAPAT